MGIGQAEDGAHAGGVAGWRQGRGLGDVILPSARAAGSDRVPATIGNWGISTTRISRSARPRKRTWPRPRSGVAQNPVAHRWAAKAERAGAPSVDRRAAKGGGRASPQALQPQDSARRKSGGTDSCIEAAEVAFRATNSGGESESGLQLVEWNGMTRSLEKGTVRGRADGKGREGHVQRSHDPIRTWSRRCTIRRVRRATFEVHNGKNLPSVRHRGHVDTSSRVCTDADLRGNTTGKKKALTATVNRAAADGSLESNPSFARMSRKCAGHRAGAGGT